MSYFKCLYFFVCDLAVMDEDLGLVVCDKEDKNCIYCEEVFK